MISNVIWNFLGSQLLSNILLLITLLVAFGIGYRQIVLNDVVEIYATPSFKTMIDSATGSEVVLPIVDVRNVGTRLVYLEKYIFNGSAYGTNDQILPSSYSQAGGLYWIDLPGPKSTITHVSINMYYRDLDGRKWKSEIVADQVNGSWKISTLPRSAQ